MKIFILLTAVLFSVSFAFAGSASLVGSASIRAPAVILSNNTGSLTTISLRVTTGDGYVNITGPQIVGASTLQSAEVGAKYAAQYLSMNPNSYNFTYSIAGAGENVSGPSGGTAMTLLAISALSGKHFTNNFTVTGTISSTGQVGLIGGVYDKSQAAKNEGMRFIIVPSAAGDSSMVELYALVQDAVGIPLIQVSNMSQAAAFAFGTQSPTGAGVNFSFYKNYSVSGISAAPLSCSNACNESQFNELASFTFNFTNSSVAALGKTGTFNTTAGQMQSLQGEYAALAAKGYLYAASDLSFLNYINSYYFRSYAATESSAFSTLQTVYSYCNSQLPPQMTHSNYEYVIGGELRQSWGEYTANLSISTYNTTVQTTDDVLQMMKEAGTSNAWCRAANEMYNIAAFSGGTSVVPSQSLGNIAYQKISRASTYGNNMYLDAAKAAYSVNNYPLAIVEADYGYALLNTSASGMSTPQILNASSELIKNATYGVWATQFANEAEFYIQEARTQSSNASMARSYAMEAYSSASLASQLSQDMYLIYNNLVQGSGTPQIGPAGTTQSSSSIASTQEVNVLFGIAASMIILNIILFFIIIGLLLPILKMQNEMKRHGATRTRRTMRRIRR